MKALAIVLSGAALFAACTPLPEFDAHHSVAPPSQPVPVPVTPAVTTGHAVDNLFATPTPAAVNDLLAQHTPTDDERSLIIAYWAGVLASRKTGKLPDYFHYYDVIGRVRALAAFYPHYFAVGMEGQPTYVPGPLKLRDTADGAVDCAQDCSLLSANYETANTLSSCLSAASPIIKTAAEALQAKKIVGATKIVQKIQDYVSVGKSPYDAFRAIDGASDPSKSAGSTAFDYTAAVIDGTLAVIGVAALAPEVLALGAGAEVGFMIVGGIMGALECGKGFSELAQKRATCQQQHDQYCQCPPPNVKCGNLCLTQLNLRSSDAACGTCGTTCAIDEACVNGGCLSKVCNGLQTAGGNTPESRAVELGDVSGRVTFTWDARAVPDQFTVRYDGQVVFDTGCISGVGSKEISFSGDSSTMDVSVTPNCAGDSSTAWNFAVSCPVLLP